MFTILIFITLLINCYSVYAILDGRIKPIVLENRYTFTNFEWAQGYVHFKGGFDLPVNGTIILKLEEEPPIISSVNLNNGTIILYKHLGFEDGFSLRGNGFIIGKNAKITYHTIVRFDTEKYINLSGNIKFRGKGFAFIDAGGTGPTLIPGTTFDARNADALEFVNCTFTDRGRLLTSSTNPQKLLFKNCVLRLTPGTWSNPEVIFEGNNYMGVETAIHFFNKITIHPFSNLTVSQRSSIQISELDVQSAESIFRLESANLILSGTSATSILSLGNINSPTQGRMIIDGTSTLSLDNGSKIAIAPSLSLELVAGARLALTQGIVQLQ